MTDRARKLLHDAMEQGAAFIAQLSPSQRAALVGGVNEAYRGAFVVSAIVAAIGAMIAATVPRLDWTEPADPSSEAQ